MKADPPIKYGCGSKFGCARNGQPYTLLTPGAYIQPTDGNIFWHIINYTPDTDESKTLNAFSRAMDIWQPAFPAEIQLEPTGNVNEAHIKLFFVGKNHPEYDDVFDGEDGVLAYGFAPVDDEPLKGYILMDDGEQWADMHSSTTKDLLTVLLHELGHVFNLGHEPSVRQAVMYPSYSGIRHKLHPDDIEGIQAIYGRFGPPIDPPSGGCLSVLLPFLLIFGSMG